jgi:HSP20 family protein
MSKTWFPAVDIAENDKEVIVRAEVPGVDPQSLDITVANNRLTLSGEKKETSEKKGTDYYHTETRYGSFSRTLELPAGVDTEHVTAEHGHGVVTVTLTKTQAAATKRIHVKTT